MTPPTVRRTSGSALALTRRELLACTIAGAGEAGEGDLPDPWAWRDLAAHPEATATVIRTRISSERSPSRGRIIRWPKETGGWRPMAWLDPLDQITYRTHVGRVVPTIAAAVDTDNVLSARMETGPPGWRLEPWRQGVRERRERGLSLLDSHRVLGVIDIENYYPSISREVLESTIGSLPVHARSYETLLNWLGELDEWGIRGVPTGHEPSRVLADGVLVPCDSVLSRAAIPYLRYVDDTWFFVQDPRQFDELVETYRSRAMDLGLTLHPVKTQWYAEHEAREEVSSRAIEYAQHAMNSGGQGGLDAALQLMDYALEDPGVRKSELRMAIDGLLEHQHERPAKELRANTQLLRFAPEKWARYLQRYATWKVTDPAIDDDWLAEQAAQAASDDVLYQRLIFLRALTRRQLGKETGRQILELAKTVGPDTEPTRVWAAHVWSKSDAYNPNTAVELVEDHGGYSTKRAFALTLAQRRENRRFSKWVGKVRRVSAELEPTADWLEAA